MGTHHGGNGGDQPPDGDRQPDHPELPELPPEWGEIAIPDDPSALAAEAERIREELAHEAEPDHPSEPAGPAGDPLIDNLLGPDSGPSDDPGPGGQIEPSVRPPLLIVGIAVAVALVSLFIMAWSGAGSPPADRADRDGGPAALPPITLTDQAGRQVALTAQPPMALLLVEECACQQLIAATTAAAPTGVRVVTVGASPPQEPPGLRPTDPAPLRLADPSGTVRTRLNLDPPTDAATVVLVDADGQITHTTPAASSVAQYQSELTSLAG